MDKGVSEETYTGVYFSFFRNYAQLHVVSKDIWRHNDALYVHTYHPSFKSIHVLTAHDHTRAVTYMYTLKTYT